VGLTNAEIDLIATQVVERLSEENLLLHSVPYIHGSPGLVVDEARARATSCKCVEYAPNKRLCWSAGIIGAMTDEQEREYCPTTYDISRPGTVERMRKWRESVDACKGELAKIPNATGEERVTTWLRCMSSALSAKGVTS